VLTTSDRYKGNLDFFGGVKACMEHPKFNEYLYRYLINRLTPPSAPRCSPTPPLAARCSASSGRPASPLYSTCLCLHPGAVGPDELSRASSSTRVPAKAVYQAYRSWAVDNRVAEKSLLAMNELPSELHSIMPESLHLVQYGGSGARWSAAVLEGQGAQRV
jgi:hypothetical protein